MGMNVIIGNSLDNGRVEVYTMDKLGSTQRLSLPSKEKADEFSASYKKFVKQNSVMYDIGYFAIGITVGMLAGRFVKKDAASWKRILTVMLGSMAGALASLPFLTNVFVNNVEKFLKNNDVQVVNRGEQSK